MVPASPGRDAEFLQSRSSVREMDSVLRGTMEASIPLSAQAPVELTYKYTHTYTRIYIYIYIRIYVHIHVCV